LVSKKLSGIRLVSVKLEVSGEPTAECAETLQQFIAPGLARDAKLPSVRNMDLDLIAFPELQGFNDSGRETHGEAIAPFGDLHAGVPSR
jgi:hypothetical protein